MLKNLFYIVLIILFSACRDLSQFDENIKPSEELQIGVKIDALGDRVSRIFQDSENNYWFAHNGVVRYDGKELIQFTTDDGLYANRVRDIQEDHLGNILFDTGEGVNKFNGKTIEKLIPIEDQEQAKGLNPEDLWFAGKWNIDGVYRYDGENLCYLKLPKHVLEKEAREINPNVTFSLYSSYTTFKDNSGNAWFGGSTFGACRFDGTDFFWVSEREMTEIDPGPAMGVRSIVQDRDGNFYFASNVSSKYEVLNVDGSTSYKKLPGIHTSEESPPYTSCISMVMDDNGDFWMANYKGGIWKYDGEVFTHYPILIDGVEAELFSVYKDRSGTLWLGTHNAGTWKFDGEKFSLFVPELAKP